MNTHSKKTLLSIAVTTVMLTACGGGSSDAVKPDTSSNPSPNATKPLGKNALKASGTTSAFLAYYQQALNNGQKTGSNQIAATASTAIGTDGTKSENSSADSTQSSTSGFGVSTTNLIEQGVDEADIAKQNASHIFTIGNERNNKNETVSVIKAFAKPSTTEVGRYTLENNTGLNGAFLTGNMLVTLANTSQPNWYIPNTLAFENGKIETVTFDISNPKEIAKSKRYTWDGYVKTSRRIGNDLYVISSSSIQNPWGCAYTSGVVEDGKAARNASQTAAKIAPYCGQPKPLTEKQIKERMPVDINGNKIKPESCLIPQKYDKNSGYINGNITLVTKIDLTDDAKHKTTCIAASAEHVYMNTKSLYLAGYSYNTPNSEQTLINKFSLSENGTEAVTYKGTGAVNGYINWTAPSFSMNEHNDVLRVITTEQKTNVKNMLHTLKEAGEKLELTTLATLPNQENPASIGKINERVQGIRFFGNEGYVVTFKNTDPLYKIDLTNPAKPKIKGQLEMPGYSAYLQKVNDKYLLGVGYSADEKGQRTGIQTTVFDTSSDNPVIVSQKTIQNNNDNSAWFRLPVDQDSRAIMTLKNNKVMRLSVPYQRHGNGNRYYENKLEGAEYELDLETGRLEEIQSRYLGQSNNGGNYVRPLLDGNNIFYNFYNGGLSHYQWKNAKLISSSKPLYTRNISTHNYNGNTLYPSGIIKTDAEYKKLREYVNGLPDSINFSKYRVVVFSKNSVKKDIDISNIVENENTLTANVVTTNYTCNSNSQQSNTQKPTPLSIIYLVESAANNVTFQEKTVTNDCK